MMFASKIFDDCACAALFSLTFALASQAFVFIKPHAVTEKVKETVKAGLEAKGAGVPVWLVGVLALLCVWAALGDTARWLVSAAWMRVMAAAGDRSSARRRGYRKARSAADELDVELEEEAESHGVPGALPDGHVEVL